MTGAARAALVGLGALAAGAIAWGVLIEPRLIDWVEQEAKVPRLPRRWHGRRVAVIADLQVGPWWANTGTVRRAIERLARARPDVVLVAGDLIYGKSERPWEQVRIAATLLRTLPDAGIPTYAVLGNHDYLTRDAAPEGAGEALAGMVRVMLRDVGVQILHNETVVMSDPRPQLADAPRSSAGEVLGGRHPHDGRLHLVAIGSHVPGRDDPDAAFAGIAPDEPRIVLMHDPETFRRLSPGVAPFAVAGHTHGGQIRVPFRPRWIPRKLAEPGAIFDDGWLRDEGEAGNNLYVNRGLGFSLVPVRFGCPPEVTIFTLLPAA